jgi:CheY-like chemotaxis protein
MLTESRAMIMVIGGDSNFCFLIRRYIRQSLHRAVLVNLTEDAIGIAHREKPIAIILEVDHPGSADWSVLRALKTDECTRRIPVVLCSWKDDDPDYQSADHKAEVFLRKPVLYEDFQAALAQLGISSEGLKGK